MGKYVNHKLEGEIALVTIDNPPVNAFSKPVIEDFVETFERLKTIKLRAVILTGAGKAFQSGADVNMFLDVRTEEDGLALGKMVQELTNIVADMECPTIAAINGLALGGGTEVALSCDIRIASTNAVFGLTEVGFGVIPGAGGTQRMPRLIGPGKAKLLIFTGNKIDAIEALKIGLVDIVVEPDQLMAEAMKLAQQISENSPTAVKAAKKAIDEGLDIPLEEALMVERKYLAKLMKIGDHLEGTKAFFEKRKPYYIIHD